MKLQIADRAEEGLRTQSRLPIRHRDGVVLATTQRFYVVIDFSADVHIPKKHGFGCALWAGNLIPRTTGHEIVWFEGEPLLCQFLGGHFERPLTESFLKSSQPGAGLRHLGSHLTGNLSPTLVEERIDRIGVRPEEAP